jgi:hypothetical protein
MQHRHHHHSILNYVANTKHVTSFSHFKAGFILCVICCHFTYNRRLERQVRDVRERGVNSFDFLFVQGGIQIEENEFLSNKTN